MANRHHRRGFTLLEILVAIGIMVVLLGIGVLGYQKLDKVVSDRATRTRLEALAAMSSDVDILTPIVSLPQATVAADIISPTKSVTGAFYTTGTVALNSSSLTVGSSAGLAGSGAMGSQSNLISGQYIPIGTTYTGSGLSQNATGSGSITVAGPFDVNIGQPDRFSEHWPNANTYQNLMVLNTGAVLYGFQNVPAAKLVFSQLPSDAIMQSNGATPTSPWQEKFPGPGVVPGQPASGLICYPVVLDAWKNPIIFVPACGLTGVMAGGAVHKIVAADGQPFWASAGQDGDFSTGDDNVYSRPVLLK